MSLTVTMPQLGETVTEGTILSWAKQIGDSVVEDEVLVEISTDKVDTEMPSPASGVVTEILVAAGETVEVGTPIAVIGESIDAAAPAPEPVAAPAPEPAAAPAPEPTPAPASPSVAEASAPVAAMGPTGHPRWAPPGHRIRRRARSRLVRNPLPRLRHGSRRAVLSPVVRRLAAEHDVDLDLVTGTGDGGRITRKDIEIYIAAPSPAPAQTEPVSEPAARRTTAGCRFDSCTEPAQPAGRSNRRRLPRRCRPPLRPPLLQPR